MIFIGVKRLLAKKPTRSTPNLGQVQNLKIIGYIFTEHTFGCRVELSEEQLEQYDQNENFNSFRKRQFGTPGSSVKKIINKNNFSEVTGG